MKTLQAILNEYGEQIFEEIEDLFEDETAQVELRFYFDEDGFVNVQAFHKKIVETEVNLDEKPEFVLKLEGIKNEFQN